MVPPPRRQNPQHQRLTVALRKICRDYPPGAGVLKELLQNADDAGATTVEFVLDTSTHIQSPLLVDELADYQGPALLAYNDGVFTDEDFDSLTALGNSKKIQNKAATGKFGLGFSSVYNWTDSPSVLSQETLQFLDPHESWSKEFKPPGGPNYDFPASSQDRAMANQLDAFSLINQEWGSPFPGTIVRIPLRTKSQAASSDISSNPTSIDDVRSAMDSFVVEMGISALLFLKSVGRIILRVNDQQLHEVQVLNGQAIAAPKKRLKAILEGVMNEDNLTDDETYHEVRIQCSSKGHEAVQTFGVFNMVTGSASDATLTEWTKSEKFFPWVALAAPLKKCDDVEKNGHFFSVLPLPVRTEAFVHVHGCFSITPDRSRIHGPDLAGLQDHRPVKWNQFLFHQMLPMAWSRLLYHICSNRNSQDIFHLWPPIALNAHDWLAKMRRNVIDYQSEHDHRVWFTDIGYVSLKNGILAPDTTAADLKGAFQEAQIPMIYLVDHMFNAARLAVGSHSISPDTIFMHLRGRRSLDSVTHSSKIILLQFLQKDVSLQGLANLEIFPFKDNKFRSLVPGPIFIHRDALDEKLFARHQKITLDADQLPEYLKGKLLSLASQRESNVRHPGLTDLRDYLLSYGPQKEHEQDITSCTDDSLLLRTVWKWFRIHCPDPGCLKALRDVPLVPLRSSKVRRLLPRYAHDSVTRISAGRAKEAALKLMSIDPSKAPHLLKEDCLDEEDIPYFLSLQAALPSSRLYNGNETAAFVFFLYEAQGLLQRADEGLKSSLYCIVEDMYYSVLNPVTNINVEHLKCLCIFRKVEWVSENNSPTKLVTSSTNLVGHGSCIGLRTLIPLVPSSGRCFLDLTSERTQQFYLEFNLADIWDEIKLLQGLVIPDLQCGSYECMASDERIVVANAIGRHYSQLSKSTQDLLPRVPFVPYETPATNSGHRFGCPKDMVDRYRTEIYGIYFEHEFFLPKKNFFDEHAFLLLRCGLINRLESRVIEGRVQAYKKNGPKMEAVASCAQKLLALPVADYQDVSDECNGLVQLAQWLPARASDGSILLVDSSKCRDIREKPLIGRVWHTLPFKVDDSWYPLLGWQALISIDTLVNQIGQNIDALDTKSNKRVLEYLDKNYKTDDYRNFLSSTAFIQSSQKGHLVTAEMACKKGCENLTPFLFNVDTGFWYQHWKILTTIGVTERPSLEQLCRVLDSLESKCPLEEVDLEVCVGVLHMWGARFGDQQEQLRVPDQAGVLQAARYMVSDDPLLTDITVLSKIGRYMVHPKISRSLADLLKIQPLRDLLKDAELGISDFDGDEFDQREEVADGIKDTLSRYSVDSTFQEYIANADDCKPPASEISFVFDPSCYGTEHLITDDLAGMQGPALLIHNDGVFRDEDFDGLKRVGYGSKRDDPVTIGKFGRGSQTMYHWTDVPMILSGENLVILDPLRKYLPFVWGTNRRRPGLILKYSRVRTSSTDQLAPFEGKWGFDSKKEFYKGTIFRFPLRGPGIQSALLESTEYPDTTSTIQTLRNFFNDARLSLIFLRNVSHISFSTTDDRKVGWSVSRGSWPEAGTFSGWANTKVKNQSINGRVIETEEKWWRAMEDVSNIPGHLKPHQKRRMKFLECGIAAQICEEKSEARIPPRYFNCLPLRFETFLPIHIHASFLLSGDRQNIAIEETSQNAGADWNKWFLQTKVPELYLQFLEDVGRQIGHHVYQYFPASSTNGLSMLTQKAFWESFRRCRHRLLPVVEPVEFSSLTAKDRRQSRRQAPRFVEPKEAIFDLLDTQRSNSLGLLSSNCVKNLVRLPPNLRKYVRDMPDFQYLTPSIIRRELRSEKATIYMNVMKQTPGDLFPRLLSYIHPKDNELTDFEELNGCSILPLRNGSLGKLTVRERKDMHSETFFVADSESLKLFSFASSKFIDDEGCKGFVQAVSNFSKTNVKALEMDGLNTILRCQTTWVADSNHKEWLVTFWKYVNAQLTSPAPSPDTSITTVLKDVMDFPLFWCLRSGAETIESFNSIKNTPYVLSSSNKLVGKLYAAFPGMGIVDFGTYPQAFRPKDNTLLRSTSLEMLLHSIKFLAWKDKQGITDYVQARLEKHRIKTLREILEQFKDPGHKSSVVEIAMDLPVWESVASNDSYITARSARKAEEPGFIVPWMRDYSSFVEDPIPLPISIVSKLDMLTRHVLPSLPERLVQASVQPYLNLTTALSGCRFQTPGLFKLGLNSIISLTHVRLALKQDGELCLTSSLFDSSEPIFVAAFRFQERTRFLHNGLRHHNRPLWLHLGLRRFTGDQQGENYQECLKALAQRLEGGYDEHQAQDIQTILQPLQSSSTFTLWNPAIWTSVSQYLIFPVATPSENEPAYRKGQMTKLSAQRNYLSFQMIVPREYASICWSQTPFVLHEPSAPTLRQSRSKAQPSYTMVWKHLEFLAATAPFVKETEIPSFVADLWDTYRFLHLNQNESSAAFCVRDADVWLNADIDDLKIIPTETFHTSWTSLGNLILDMPCDAPPLQQVLSSLAPFSSLLKKLGCQSIQYPQVTIDAVVPNGNEKSTINRLHEQQKQGRHTDVILGAQGKTISAHKAVLATRSLYCDRQFGGPWARFSEGSPENRIIDLEDMLFDTLEILIHYCYIPNLNWASRMRVSDNDDIHAVADKLDSLLDVLTAADRWIMSELRQKAEEQVITGVKYFVRPDNVHIVKERAEEAHAQKLLSYCAEYEMCNAAAILLANV